MHRAYFCLMTCRLEQCMVEQASLNSVVDKLQHADVGTDCSWLDERIDLNNVV